MIAKFIASRFSGYIAIASVVAVLGLVYYIYNEGKQACENKVVNLEIGLMEERNNIANQRPDAAAVIERLRRGSF